MRILRWTAACAAGVMASSLLLTQPASAAPEVTPPPVGARFDYQIGGAYDVPNGVRVVSRDWQADPARGLYNIAYVNAMQAQPGRGVGSHPWFARQAPELFLKRNGQFVVDGGWGETLLDISTPAKRQRLVDLQKPWLDEIAKRGFQAVEPDNQDSFLRSRGRLSKSDAWAYLTLFTQAAHERGLAVAQKNNAEYTDIGKNQIGFDFAIAEECAIWNECGDYIDAYGRNVISIEYRDQSASAFRRSVSRYGDQISLVRRDRGVSPRGAGGYFYQTGNN